MPSAPAGQLGQLQPFNIEHGNVHAWIEQFDIFCSLNKVTGERKVLLFLFSVGTEAYNAIRELVLPDSPAKQSFEELKKVLVNHIQPPPNFLMERFKFRDRKQLSNETINQYVEVLKKMSEFCQFESELENYLRDQLIWGVQSSEIKRRLLADGGKLSFNKCVEIATTMEQASAHTVELSGGSRYFTY